jgi:hypothetical protein
MPRASDASRSVSLRRARRAGRDRARDCGVLPDDGRHAGQSVERRRHGGARYDRQAAPLVPRNRPAAEIRRAPHRDLCAELPGPHGRLKARNLVNREDNQYQYRFRDIVDLDSNKHLFTIEHEVRCVTHPMFLRPLVNRNPVQTNRNYAMGHDEWRWAMDPSHYDNQP